MSAETHSDIELVEGEEVVDGLPVLAEVRTLEPSSPASLPAVQAAAAAATGFVAGAATIALFRRHSARRLARARAGGQRGPTGLPIVGTRSFLVDVHLIAKPGD
ncbi:MAG: hypothetical protein ACLPTJ_00440 [Solirubrobacteraceae bacterium]